MKTSAILGATVATLAVLSAPAEAKPKAANSDQRELHYFLPKTRVAAGVQQQLLRCPTDALPPLVATTVAIVDKLGPDPAGFVRVNARSGVLTGRTTRLELRPNGTLSAFNATTQGEGGTVLSAAIGAATTLISASVGIPLIGAPSAVEAAPKLACNDVTRDLVNRFGVVEAQIAMLQARVAEGTDTASTGLTLTSLRGELEYLKKRLTLTSSGPALFDVTPADFQQATAQTKPVGKIDYSQWFDNSNLLDNTFVGKHGFQATLTPNGPLLKVLKAGDGSALPPTGSTPYLFYRRPVPATVSVVPCAKDSPSNGCKADESVEGAAASDQKSVLLPQLSGLFHLPIGNSNLFGTRRAVASFDEQGAPLALEYGSTAGGAEIAGVITAATTGFTTIRNAETTEMTRRIDNLKAQKELEALLDEQQ